MRRDVRGHAHGNAGGAIDQQVRDARGQDRGFHSLLVEIRHQVDGFLLNVREQLHGDGRQAALRITVGGRGIPVHRSKIALAVDGRVAHVECLRHAHQRVIDRRIAVRMVFLRGTRPTTPAHLRVLAPGNQIHLVHGVQNPPVHGLEAVAHVGHGAADDHAHGVVEIRLLHLGFDIDWKKRHPGGRSSAIC